MKFYDKPKPMGTGKLIEIKPGDIFQFSTENGYVNKYRLHAEWTNHVILENMEHDVPKRKIRNEAFMDGLFPEDKQRYTT